jgi:hypothetical protein
MNTTQEARTAQVKKKPYPSIKSIVFALAMMLLVFAFITGRTTRFYASFLFLFYSVIGSMWLSVVGLGVFQTLLLIPVRIINLTRASHTEAYKKTIKEQAAAKEQQFLIKQDVREGNPVLLWYTFSFTLQLVSYITIGRLFLIDFYNTKLDPNLLYSWVPYPEYPIEGLIFKLPYIAVTETTNLGWRVVLIVWLIIMLLQALIYVVRMWRERRKKTGNTPQSKVVSRALTFTSGSTVLLMIAAWYVITHFPIGFELRLFTGSIAVPNRTFNAVTAIATFFTIFWLDLSKIRKRATVAEAEGIDQDIIETTQREQMKDSVRNGGLIGLGAFFITNHIPSAFELSIFTFEIISWLSPFTLDKIITAGVKRKPETPTSDGGGNGGTADNNQPEPEQAAQEDMVATEQVDNTEEQSLHVTVGQSPDKRSSLENEAGGTEEKKPAEERSLSGEILIG